MEWLVPILDAVLGSLVRSGLMMITGFLLERHLVTQQVADQFVSDGVTHVIIAIPAVLAIAWSVWVKIRGRARFLTALESAPGTTEEQVKDKVAAGMGVSVKAGAVLLACALGVSMACSLPLKQRVVSGLQVTETALEVSHDAERRLCAPTADQTRGIGHCDGADAAAFGLTDTVHAKAASLYSRAFDLQGKAAVAAKAWRAGDPVPSDVQSYRLALHDILDVLAAVVPKEQLVIAKLQEAINQAADLAVLAGVK